MIEPFLFSILLLPKKIPTHSTLDTPLIFKRERSPNFSIIAKNAWNEDSKSVSRILLPIRIETIARGGANKNLTRSGGAEKRCSKRKKGGGRGREGGGWQRGRVYDSRSTRRAKGATAKLVIIRPYFFVASCEKTGCGRRWR